MTSSSQNAQPLSPGRVVAVVVGLLAVLGGVGVLLVMLSRQLRDGGEPHLAIWILAILASGAGWLLLELVGGAVLEAIMLPVRGAARRFLPQPIQNALNRTIGGPWLLLAILSGMLILTLALSLWFTS